MEYDFLEKYEQLKDTIGAMIRADKKGMLGDDAWLPVNGGDIKYISEAIGGEYLHISGITWTMQTGGSHEYWEIQVSKADIELFALKQKLGATS